jgi:WD40 repeat protein
MKNNPYVGPRPYERGDRRNFFGRKREARDLLSLILAERVVLFYAPSGAGKTSLLNAQVIPALEEEGFNVLPAARVGSDLPPGIDPQDVQNVFAFSALMGLAGEDVPADTLTGHTLLSFLRQNWPEEGEGLEHRPPILILDQFEEILTTHRDRWQDAQGFFEQVRDALQGMRSLGVVFTMREDHVAGLDPYARLVPRRLRARFRMERLDRAGGLEAVRQPALNAGCPFDPGVAERLVDDLRRIKTHRYGDAPDLSEGINESGDRAEDGESVLGPFVEPVQLQVVCNRLWDNLPDQEDNAIQWEEVEKFGNIDRALTDFYESALSRCVQETGVRERQLRRWFGEQLITPMETRGLALRGENETGGLPNEAVDSLEGQHLIRAEARAGARWYELSHDRMVDPILRSNQVWRMARQTPLRLAAQRWRDRGEDSGILYRGESLREAEAWAEANPDEVEPYERRFLQASQRAEQARTRMRILRITGTVAAVLTIVAVSVLAVAAYRAGQMARSRTWASNSMRYRSINQELSIILAQKAVAEADTPEAQIALRQALIDYYPAEVLKDKAIDHIASVAYSPDGQSLAAGTANGQVHVWDTAAHRPVLTITLARGADWVYGLAYSPNGRLLATGSDQPIQIWDTSTGELVNTLSGYTQRVYSLDYSPPDGRFLASGHHDAKVRIWDGLTGTPVITLTGHTGAVRGLDYSPDGRFIATASWDKTVRLWEISITPGGVLTATTMMKLAAHTGGVNSVAFSPNGRYLASGSSDHTIRLWDLIQEQTVMTWVGHDDQITHLNFSADSKYLISGSSDATVRIWDATMRQKEAIAILTGHTGVVNGVAFSPSGRFLASGSADGTVRVWDTESPPSARLATLTGHRKTVNSLDYSPDGRFLASGSADGTVRIWSTSTGETAMTLPLGRIVWGVTYSADGRHLVTCSSDDLARIWDVSSGTEANVVMTLSGHTEDVNAAAYSPDGRLLATASDDRTARIWDLSTGQPAITVTGHAGAIYALDYSPDGSSIATGSVDKDVRVWDLETGESIVLRGHTNSVFGVAYSPDGESLASASWDQTVRIWDLERYTTTTTLVGYSSYVYSVAYSPDGEQLATGAWDGTVRLWDLSQSSPQLIGILGGHASFVPAVTYSPDGTTIASGSEDGTVRRYLARFEDVDELSWEYVPREMTEEELDLVELLETDPFGY